MKVNIYRSLQNQREEEQKQFELNDLRTPEEKNALHNFLTVGNLFKDNFYFNK